MVTAHFRSMKIAGETQVQVVGPEAEFGVHSVFPIQDATQLPIAEVLSLLLFGSTNVTVLCRDPANSRPYLHFRST